MNRLGLLSVHVVRPGCLCAFSYLFCFGVQDSHYFDESSAKSAELRQQLDSRNEKGKVGSNETNHRCSLCFFLHVFMSALTCFDCCFLLFRSQMMQLGKDVSFLFPDVVKLVVVEQTELKKLVYMYIEHYATRTRRCCVVVHQLATERHGLAESASASECPASHRRN